MKALSIGIALSLASVGCIAQTMQADPAREGASTVPVFAARMAPTSPVQPGSLQPSMPTVTRRDATTLTDEDLRTLLADDMLSAGDEDRLYVVRTNPLEYRKVAWLPWRRASYTVNIPPGGSIIHVHSMHVMNSTGVTVRGLENTTDDWMHVSAVVDKNHLNVVPPAGANALVTLFATDDVRAVLGIVR